MNSGKPKDAWRIDREKCGLVVIDMQRAFVDAESPLYCPGAGELVPGINKLGALCRRLGMPVMFVKADRRADNSDAGLVVDFLPPGNDSNPMGTVQGRKGNEFCAGLNIMPDDHIVSKIRYSAFVQGSSNIEQLLKGLQRDAIILCGVATDVCVGSSAMDAMMLGFKVFLISDLTTTYTAQRQQTALEIYDTHFARVVSSDEVVRALTITV